MVTRRDEVVRGHEAAVIGVGVETLIDLEGYIYDEIDPRHRIYVGDEPRVQYAEELRLPAVEDDEE